MIIKDGSGTLRFTQGRCGADRSPVPLTPPQVPSVAVSVAIPPFSAEYVALTARGYGSFAVPQHLIYEVDGAGRDAHERTSSLVRVPDALLKDELRWGVRTACMYLTLADALAFAQEIVRRVGEAPHMFSE